MIDHFGPNIIFVLEATTSSIRPSLSLEDPRGQLTTSLHGLGFQVFGLGLGLGLGLSVLGLVLGSCP